MIASSGTFLGFLEHSTPTKGSYILISFPSNLVNRFPIEAVVASSL